MVAETVAKKMAENLSKEVAETKSVTVKLAGGAQEEGSSAFFLVKIQHIYLFFLSAKQTHRP